LSLRVFRTGRRERRRKWRKEEKGERGSFKERKTETEKKDRPPLWSLRKHLYFLSSKNNSLK
jgi:hypothetical protein